jgi:hypothetical protein
VLVPQRLSIVDIDILFIDFLLEEVVSCGGGLAGLLLVDAVGVDIVEVVRAIEAELYFTAVVVEAFCLAELCLFGDTLRTDSVAEDLIPGDSAELVLSQHPPNQILQNWRDPIYFLIEAQLRLIK